MGYAALIVAPFEGPWSLTTCCSIWAIRILRNSKLELEYSIKAAMLSEFCERMRDWLY